jgi:ABC-type multidrug transport system ATPase subunit
MQIILKGVGKKFGREWIFKGIDKVVTAGKPLAITGPNGSGKSTLMLIISGWTLPSSGEISYIQNSKELPPDKFYRNIDFVAPYTELVEELTLDEFLRFHFRFKGLRNGLEIDEIIRKVRLQHDKSKYISHFSSGMKQRLKLALGLYSNSPVLLLDEPTTNLDSDNKSWYSEEIQSALKQKIVIIASNQPDEYNFATDYIKIEMYK